MIKMEIKIVLHYVGKKVRLVMGNSYNYTCVIPKLKDWSGEKTFCIKDKFGESVAIDVEFIMIINEINENSRRNM